MIKYLIACLKEAKYFKEVTDFKSYNVKYFNPIQDGGGQWRAGQKGPPTSFSPVTSTNVGISPQNFLTFSFNPFATLA